MITKSVVLIVLDALQRRLRWTVSSDLTGNIQVAVYSLPWGVDLQVRRSATASSVSGNGTSRSSLAGTRTSWPEKKLKDIIIVSICC